MRRPPVIALAVGAGLSLAFVLLGLAFWSQTADRRDECPARESCLFVGDTIYHTNPGRALALWLTAILTAAATFRIVILLGRRRPFRLGGWRNPVDSVGLWYRDLPYWRRFTIAVLFTPAVIAWWVAYEFRRGWFGPPD
jgi:hypothetical protein